MNCKLAFKYQRYQESNPGFLGHKLIGVTIRSPPLRAQNDGLVSPSGPDDVFVGDREEVPLLVGELDPGLGDGLHGGGHVVVALSLRRDKNR